MATPDQDRKDAAPPTSVNVSDGGKINWLAWLALAAGLLALIWYLTRNRDDAVTTIPADNVAVAGGNAVAPVGSNLPAN